MELVLSSCVHGYHVLGEEWVDILAEKLREIGNVINRYAIAVKKDSGETVGHVLKISSICSLFLQQDCTITDKYKQTLTEFHVVKATTQDLITCMKEDGVIIEIRARVWQQGTT